MLLGQSAVFVDIQLLLSPWANAQTLCIWIGTSSVETGKHVHTENNYTNSSKVKRV